MSVVISIKKSAFEYLLFVGLSYCNYNWVVSLLFP